MRHFIEQFYYGNIDPQERSTKMNKSAQKQLEIMVNSEETLSKTLTEELKKLFLDYVDAWHEVNSESNLDSFIIGFRLGAAFTYDTFVSTDAPFTSYSED